MKIIVQKFGGTSVSTDEKRKKVVEKVKKAISNGYNPVIVVSAMGRKGEPYATDTLLSIMDSGFKGENKLAADLLMCCGELISAVVMANKLYLEGIDAVPLSGGQAGIITDSKFNDASLKDFDDKRILDILAEGKVPVITGFQGVTEDGYFTTLGRGGSDTSAAIVGVGLDAEKIEIYTDVDGIMTADPRIVQEASLINVLSYDEVFQLADQGAKVIHPNAVEIAKIGNIPLVIKNTMNDCEGTVINNVGDKKNRRLVTSITSHNDRVQVRIKLDDNKGNESYQDILEVIAENKISLDLINIFPTEQIFTIPASAKERVLELFKSLNINAIFKEDLSTIAIVGAGMRGIPGVMAKIYKALNYNRIEVLQTADSHMTIWCLINRENLSEAINALHTAFKLC
ncbi:aspartate kinase [Clostridium sp. SHJSY1]|uniref:aspartate kinase n=1 Tax=Clostridium sp. SHJSY1 TaxID=2942483 RepID=UPI002876A1EF|nr:aspartate kinase [Clostridium sp. SHJSY1]MDS0524878.1 aspartate kinase [Clostridium sp. SHJSY1]